MNKPIRQLWLILSAAFVIFFIASAFDHINIFGVELKPSELYSTVAVNNKNEINDSIEITSSVPDDTLTQKVQFPQPLDTTSKSILFIGDSMLEGLYPRLAAYAEKNGHKLNTVIWYSSTSQTWGKCDTLTHFIDKFKPNYIFVCLGANELFIKDIKKKRANYIDHMMGEIKDIPLLWIGPPNWKEDTGINGLLQSKLPKGSFFLSNGMHFDRSKDGAHPTRASASLWMDSVVRWMPQNALHPIKMDLPDKKSARANKVVVLQPEK